MPAYLSLPSPAAAPYVPKYTEEHYDRLSAAISRELAARRRFARTGTQADWNRAYKAARRVSAILAE